MATETDLAMDQVAGIVYSMIDAYNVIVDGAEPRARWSETDEEEQAATINAVTHRSRYPEHGPIDAHDDWRSIMAERGWTHGPELDFEAQAHPNMVPWDELTEAAKRMSVLIYQATMILARPIEEVL